MFKEIDYAISGYAKFRQKYFNGDNQIFEQLKDGQNPKFLVIACSDSRVDPTIILNCKPGDLFVIRNVANLIPPCQNDNAHRATSAALEFGICGLGIKDIIILGHSNCGGIRALVEQSATTTKSGSFISNWMEIAKTSYQKTIQKYPKNSIDEQANHCSKFAIINSLKNLTTFPWIKERLDNNELNLHGWHFDIKTGTIKVFNKESEEFEELIK